MFKTFRIYPCPKIQKEKYSNKCAFNKIKVVCKIKIVKSLYYKYSEIYWKFNMLCILLIEGVSALQNT